MAGCPTNRIGRLCTTASTRRRHTAGNVRIASVTGAPMASPTGAIICSSMCWIAGTTNSVRS